MVVVLQKCITALEKMWHPEHFFCAQCGRQFGDEDFHEKNGKAYCRLVSVCVCVCVCVCVHACVCMYVHPYMYVCVCELVCVCVCVRERESY